MPIQEKLNEILQQTEDDIVNRRNYKFTVAKSFPENIRKDYYEKYIAKSINKNSVHAETIDIKRGGEIKKEKITYEAMPMHNYNTLLAMAFYKAFEFYSTVRKKLKADSGQTITMEANTDEETTTGLPTLSGVECLVLSRQLQQGKNSALLKSIKKNEIKQLNEFQKIEHLNVKVLEELRNYHAHIFHEPGPIYFDNFYGDDYKPKKKLSTQEWHLARDYFQKLFYDTKEHLLKSVNEQLQENLDNEASLAEIEKVKTRISSYKFQINGILTHNALLFIACNFLRKSDANFFIKKWTGIKKTEGFSKTSQTFFNYYSLKDSKSLSTHNQDLFKFRQLLSILGTMPVLKNECFKPFYELIEINNNYYKEKVERAWSKADKESYQKNIIPLRKSLNYTKWYMQYLKDKGLLNRFKIAFYKRIEERQQLLEKSGIGVKIEELKLKIKRSSGDEKKKLNEIYKQSKKNFVFRTPDTDDNNFCTKIENAIVQYSFKPIDSEVNIQVNLSPAFLMKWIFADIFLSKGEEVLKSFELFIREVYYKLQAGSFESIQNISASKLLPSSLLRNNEIPEVAITLEKAKSIISARKNELQRFLEENEATKAPWRFAAKQKIDIIFDYVHLKYLSAAYDSNKDTDTIRHEALNDMEYLDAFEEIRFYGREYKSEEFKELFKVNKAVYFKPILRYFENSTCTSLEKLFNAVSNDYLKYLIKTEHNINESTLAKVIYIFKIKNKVANPNKLKLAKLFSVSQDIPHELINIKELANQSAEFQEWQALNKDKDANRLTDFSLMRFILSKDKPFSNTDYMMQCIMPILLKNGELLGENGKIRGNTSLFNNLYSSKTEELILWNIANYYWKKGNGRDNTRNRNILLQRNQANRIEPAYSEVNIYNKIFKEEMEIKLQRETKSENAPIYRMNIKPKKFDDEFQHYKQSSLIDYIELCSNEDRIAKSKKPLTQSEKENKIWSFEDVNKEIQDKLTKYLDDVYLLLTIEKHVVVKNISELKKKFKITSDNKLPGIYLFFGRIETAGENNIKNTVCNLVYDELEKATAVSFDHGNLILYRNKTMHQELLDEKKRMTIRKALFEYCKKNQLFQV